MHVKPRWKIFFWHKIYQVQKSPAELYIIRMWELVQLEMGPRKLQRELPTHM